MDYKPNVVLSRADIRLFASLLRKQFKVKTLHFPVMKILDLLVTLYPDDIFYSIEDDALFEDDVMAECVPPNNESNIYLIRIRESVYNGAAKKRPRFEYIGFICHELCHFFLCFFLNIKPKCEIEDGEYVENFNSMEWQAKALCGELMIPYEECMRLSPKQISWRTKSSRQQVNYYLMLVSRDLNNCI